MTEQLSRKNEECVICKKIDDFSEENGKCIFHCEKDNWIKETKNHRDWNIKLIEKFWKEFQKEKIDKEDYNFIYFIFPKFTSNGFFKFKNKKNEIIFYKAEFLDDADFGAFGHYSDKKTIFYSNVIFEKARFHRNAIFFRSTFLNRVTFNSAYFSGDADFSQTNFKGNIVDFTSTNFEKNVDFNSAKIESLTTFTLTDVKKRIDFSTAIFKTVYFLDSKFQDVKFWGTQFQENAVFSNIDFVNAIFQKVNLTNVFLSSTMRIDEIPFLECIFPEHKNRKIIFNEKIKIEKQEEKYIGSVLLGIHFSYEENENVYRKLKKSFEDRKDYETAGDFHIGEMEMRRKKFIVERKEKNTGKNWFTKFIFGIWNFIHINTTERFLVFWYWLFSDYGERPDKVIRFIFLFIIIFSFLFFWSFDFSQTHILKSIGLSIENFVPFLPKLNIEKTTLFQRIIFDIEVFISSVLWFLLIIAIRRKFKR